MDNNVLIIAVAVALIAVGLLRRRASGAGIAPVSKLRELIDGGAKVVDVRGAQEYDAKHYQGAINVPVEELHARVSELGDKSEPVVFYCNTGNRSRQAIAIARRSGYSEVYNGGGLHTMPSQDSSSS